MKTFWRVVCLMTAAWYGYWSILYAGSFFGINAVPTLSPGWNALAFASATIELAFPVRHHAERPE